MVQIEQVLTSVRAALAGVDGVAALVLGGSHATGTARENSDVDIGLLYSRDHRPPFGALSTAVSTLDDRGQPDGFG